MTDFLTKVREIAREEARAEIAAQLGAMLGGAAKVTKPTVAAKPAKRSAKKPRKAKPARVKAPKAKADKATPHDSEAAQAKVLDAIANGATSKGKIEEATGLGTRVGVVLVKLKSAGRIAMTGSRRGATYSIAAQAHAAE